MKIKQTTTKITLLFLLMFVLQNNQLFATNTPQHNCIILLDQEDNDNVGRTVVFFLMSKVQSAIAEQTTPLLMSTSLWNAFIERRLSFKHNLERNATPLHKVYTLYQTINERAERWSHHYNALSNDAIHNKKLVTQHINKEFYNNKNTISTANYQLLLNYCTHFDPQDWDIYKNNDGFYLLIPKKYSNQNIPVGFNLDALEKVTCPEDNSFMYFESHSKKSIIDALPDFFITYDDRTDMPYAWNIVLAGHGGSKYRETN
jgi:hypothetical protein